ncbi:MULTISPECIES: cellulose synthase complex periplasmic endoglucanase BcsZ [Paraburkholderia]|uniref:cellulose synthase complex periplasmic endoglucanase BcsZ n=1 Tax=Paraburkholderia TaxID=1822464 RepID=UPI002258E407|nr:MULTISPECIES: cellulose synthase complex periplasmic endoglucanase BcsZ [Paraburkholderia]MCX4159757.1 cellulose synthase complex periplasmic endoglucanase BcsZ [Paraburkholderia aspalathi]MDN7169154.1 cellulose synthase complex periplasmic endoglucanase BcsZ [Paraburkholderia sp. SECH2]MDQ6397642.1 cellulose synthase complex periplasmic endoglucanase BcsZ [Paraburkholderia aspalathi]
MRVRNIKTHVALTLGLGFGLALAAATCFANITKVAQTTSAPGQTGPCNTDWPAYRIFVEHFVQADGRVIDYSSPQLKTTSEGQSYGLFFALVANDRATFDRLLNWTRTNLAGNQFDAQNVRLPSWLWGKKPDGSFGVLDPNSASDSDLWIAYDLLQAGRLWHESSYTQLGEALAAQIARQEMTTLPGVGPMLLPGPQGFKNGGVTRLNPSYLPLPVLRALAKDMPNGPWAKLADSAYKLIKTTAPQGFAPDWAAWQNGQFVVDPKEGDTGSYDAIRVYLWAGLTSPADPLAKPWLAALGGMRAKVAQSGIPPEKVSSTTGTARGEGPLSYWGALAPYFKSLNDERGLGLARTHLAALDTNVPGREPVYYDRVLGLFGTGFIDGRYRFDEAGRLVPSWRNACD